MEVYLEMERAPEGETLCLEALEEYRLPTNDLRMEMGIALSALCPLRGVERETSIHILRDFGVVQAVWEQLDSHIPKGIFNLPTDQWVKLNIREKKPVGDIGSWSSFFGFLLTCIWFFRNQVVLHGTQFNPRDVLEMARSKVCILTMSRPNALSRLVTGNRYQVQQIRWIPRGRDGRSAMWMAQLVGMAAQLHLQVCFGTNGVSGGWDLPRIWARLGCLMRSYGGLSQRFRWHGKLVFAKSIWCVTPN